MVGNWKRENTASVLLVLSVFLVAMGLYGFLYLFDNKYTAGAPYGYEGEFAFSQEDLQRKTPLFLVDGWEFYPDAAYTPADFASGGTTPRSISLLGSTQIFLLWGKGTTPLGKLPTA